MIKKKILTILKFITEEDFNNFKLNHFLILKEEEKNCSRKTSSLYDVGGKHSSNQKIVPDRYPLTYDGRFDLVVATVHNVYWLAYICRKIRT